MGQALDRNASLKETKILNMKQNEIMTSFREGRCNLIVATSVLVANFYLSVLKEFFLMFFFFTFIRRKKELTFLPVI